MKLLRFCFAVCLLITTPLYAEDVLTFTIGQSTGTNIPVNTWVDISDTIIGQKPDYFTNFDKFLIPPSLGMWALLSSWKEISSEPNRSWMLYDPSENRYFVWTFGSTNRSEDLPDGGHPDGGVNMDPMQSVALGFMHNTGAQASDNTRQGNYYFDFFGHAGRPTMPALAPSYLNQLGNAAFDPAKRKLVEQGGDSFEGTQIFDPALNNWNIAITTSGTAPNASVQNASMTYNDNDGKIYVYGGAFAAATLPGLYRYASGTATWERLDLTQTCNVSLRTGLAACPSARMQSGWAYNRNSNTFLMFGGCTTTNSSNGCNARINDLWTYDPVANAWTELDPTCSTSYCSGNGPSLYTISPPAERFAWMPEQDLIFAQTQSFEAATPTSGKTRYWMYRSAPGARIGNVAKAHVYTISPQAAAGRAVGTLNRNSSCQDPMVDCLTQSEAYAGAIASGNSKLYQIWSETSNNTGQNSLFAHPYMQSWSGSGGIQNLGTAYSLTNDTTGPYFQSLETAIAVIGATPWACAAAQAVSTPEKVYCKGWDGAAWSMGGAINPTRAIAYYGSWPSITNNNGTPTIAVREKTNDGTPASHKGYVFEWNGSAFVQKGGLINHAGDTTTTHVQSISLASDGTNPWVAWTEYVTQPVSKALCFDVAGGGGTVSGAAITCPNAIRPQMWLSKWNGTSWAMQCGGSGNITASPFSATTGYADWASVTYMGGKAYVAFTQRLANTSTFNGMAHLFVRSCDGTTWTTIGSTYLNRDSQWGWAYRPEIVNDGTNLYVTWAEQGNQIPWIGQLSGTTSFSQHPHVFVSKWNGTAWSSVGGALNADTAYGSARHPSITILNGNPVVQWNERTQTNLQQMYAKQWNGSDWTVLSSTGGALTITTASHPGTTIGAAYSHSLALQVSGGTQPYITYTVASGALPTGVSLNSSTGLLSGTVSGASGLKTFAWRVTDSAASPATVTSVNETINVSTAPSITTATPLPVATFNSAFSQAIVTTGGAPPLAYTVTSGTLPPGLSLSSAGVLNGIPTRMDRNYTFTIRATDATGIFASKAFTMNVDPKFTFGTNNITPTGCSNTHPLNPLDLNLCVLAGEVPLGTFSIPAVGLTYDDPNFGTPVRLLSRNDIQGPSVVGYGGPSALSATGTYAALAVNSTTTIVNTTTGAVVRANASGNVTSSNSLQWSQNDDFVYYYTSGTTIKKYNWQTNVLLTVIDFATAIDKRTNLPYGWSAISTGGTGDLSGDDWMGVYSDTIKHSVAMVNLSNAHAYAGDYQAVHNGVTPTTIQANGGYVLVSKGVDSGSNKRYILATCLPNVYMSMGGGDPNDGVLNWEMTGPETPANTDSDPPHIGDDDDICEPGEHCSGIQHNATMQSAAGIQYLVGYLDFQGNQGLPFERTINYFRFSAGTRILRSSANETGGGRTTLPPLFIAADGGHIPDAHTQCAGKAPVCVFSTDAPDRAGEGDLTSAYPHGSHMNTVNFLLGVGEEWKQVAYARSIMWAAVTGNLTSIVTSGGTSTVTMTASHNIPEDALVYFYNTGVVAYNVANPPNGVGHGWRAHITSPTTFTFTGCVGTCSAASTGTFSTEGPYWPHPFASTNSTGVRVAFNSNFGYYIKEGGGNVVTALTGYGGVSPSPLALNPASLPSTTVGSAYSALVSGWASGGQFPYAWQLAPGSTALPTGVTISPAGSITGTVGLPAGTFTPTLRVVDAASDFLDAQVSITVAPITLVITPGTPPATTVGAVYSYNIASWASGGTQPYTWSVFSGNMPTGLTLSSAGLLSGTIAGSAGTFVPIIRVSDAGGQFINQQITILVNAAPVITNASPLPATMVTASYSQQLLKTGGTGSFAWSVSAGTLPVGLSLSPTTGLINGVVTGGAGTYNFTIRVVDSLNVAATKAFQLVVTGPSNNVTITIEVVLHDQGIIHYTSPDYQPCIDVISTNSNFSSPTETVSDSGGPRLRSVVFGQTTRLTPSTTYYIQVSCNVVFGTTTMATVAPITPTPKQVHFAVPVPNRTDAVDAIVEYGSSQANLNQTLVLNGTTNWEDVITFNAGQILFYRYCYRSAPVGTCVANPNVVSGISDLLFQGIT